MKRRHIIALVMLILAATLVGCGGGGGQSGSAASSGATGQAQFTVVWPTQAASHAVSPKLIPSAANSIILTLQLGQVGSSVPISQTLTRPTIGSTSTATFNNLTPGVYAVSAAAHPNANGTGVTQAQAAAPLTIVIGQTTPLNLTLASTIVSVVVTPNPTRVFVGRQPQVQLTATAFDGPNGTGNIVLTGGFNWLSGDPTRATVDNTGLVTGISVGTFTNAPPPVQITASDPESGVGGVAAVQVL